MSCILNKTVNRLVSILFSGFFIWSSLCFASCNQSAKSRNVLGDSLRAIILPETAALNAADSARIHDAALNWYDSTFRYNPLNGGMLVARNGNIVFEVYNGTAHIPGTDSINANTPTHIASVSKTFTAMMILKFVQEHKLDLNAELKQYFPDFNYPGVTIKTLLSHRSGLPNYLYFMDKLGWDKKQFMSNNDVYTWLVQKKSQIQGIGVPDKHFAYCNTNYALLALLIEKISGQSYPEFMRTQVFEPLGMTNSFVYTPADSARANPSYDWRGQLIPMNDLDLVYGDKNIFSTCRDLLLWDRALRSNVIFSDSTLEAAYTPYSNERPGVHNYGFGWRMNVYPDDSKLIFHNGWWHGNNASFIRMIPEGITIILTGNKYNRGIYHAKQLTPLFNTHYGYVPDEEESTKSSK
jgi:CubicO group peptidase (beta-lactamase class C family)